MTFPTALIAHFFSPFIKKYYILTIDNTLICFNLSKTLSASVTLNCYYKYVNREVNNLSK